MVSELSIVSDPVMLHVWSCLHNYAYSDALFAAERLYAETRSSESLYLLATTLYRIGRPKQVSSLLKSASELTPKSRYLLAKCYFDFGLYPEAEEALSGCLLSSKSLDELVETYGEQAAYVLLLLGDIRRCQGRLGDASKCYNKCLDLNPLMWTAFKTLCNMGEYPNTSTVFQVRDGLCLPTPTYRVIHQAFAPNADNMSCQMMLNKSKGIASEFEVMTSRENVNPDRLTETVPHVLLSSTDHAQEAFTDTNQNSLVHRSYATHCSKVPAPGNTEPMEVLCTPQFNLPMPVLPKAPKPEHGHRYMGKSLFGDQGSSLQLPTPSPRFGALALLSQSPMFACIPVFHQTTGPASASESVLSTSVRYSNNQTIPLRQSALNEGVPISTSTGRGASHGSGGSNVSRRRSRPVDSDLSSISRRNASGLRTHATGSEKTHHNLRSSTIQTTTSTPTFEAVSLRRLVFSSSPGGTLPLGGSSGATPASNLIINSPSQRWEPPVLRSSSHRGLPSVGNAPILIPRSGASTLDLNSPGVVSSSSTPRPSNQHSSSRRASGDVPVPEESQTSGPRTRSQVAAAAAVARASGIQRRSNRIVRGRGASRKSETRSVPQNSADASPSVQTQSSSPSMDFTEEVDNLEGPLSDVSVEGSITFGAVTNSKDLITIDIPATHKDDPRVESLSKYLELLVHLGKAYQLLSKHQWRSATRLIANLPTSQLATSRILAWAARAHMDNADYTVAQKLFAEARRLEPWQLCGMDFYSTVLWQLQSEHELSNLAHELFELDRNAPEPWCAAGNCFSLQGEHEVAIRFFRRALQVCPTSAYACTLLGHEQSALEEFDRALAAFRHALKLDPRHYNALFGMSNVYYKQEKFDLAEAHLARAVALFPHSHLLLTNLGALRGRLGHLDDGPGSALDLVTLACKIQPNNPLARYHKASILFHLGRYSEVLTELQRLLVLTPREAMVYLMIGHTYKKLGNTPQAMIHYSWAMGLDPKSANTHLRDIMTNPPVAGRNLSRRAGATGAGGGAGATGGEVTGAASASSSARSRLVPVTDDLRSSSANEEEGLDDVDDEDDDIDQAFGADTDEQSRTDDDIGTTNTTPGGLMNSAGRLASSNSSRPHRGVRRLTDFSLLYDTGDFEEDPPLSEPEDEHFETMDLGAEAEESSSHSLIDE
ncbi:unnamed protein product [Calicophoron daubneyi]|uniref:Cell division cycle protein 27 homolog n=1 Tax=Calicophoron daubneyi TaxID=300641 RepID=A0AAV2TJC0_CALDB